MEEKESDVNEARQEYDKLERQYKRELEHVKALKQKAQEEAPLVDDNNEPNLLRQQLDDLGTMELAEAEAMLEDAERKADDIVADPDVLRQYEENQRALEKAQVQLDDLTGSKERKIAELEKKVKPWRDALTNSLSEVDTLFSRYMSELGYTGMCKINQVRFCFLFELTHGVLWEFFDM